MWDVVTTFLAPPQILHLLARFGKGIPEGHSLHVGVVLKTHARLLVSE